ncbi:hypothetical protein [Desulfovibrio sp.]|uniref:hypothetical protein n=1 Tax=Desulfovibrio sp. TaxID=885 RepID=UPI003D14583D
MAAFPSPTAHNQSSLRHESMEICAHASAIPALPCPALPRDSLLPRHPRRGHVPFFPLRAGLPQVSVPQPSRFGRQERFFCPFQDGTERIKKKMKKSLPPIVNYFFNWYGVPIRIDWYPRLPFMPLCETMYRHD